jgi:amidase
VLGRSLLIRPALELAELVRSGDVSASELTDTCLAEIEAREPEINAFTFIAAEQARAVAAQIGPGDRRPFAGVPIAVKDNRAVAGMPLSAGSRLFADFRPPGDAFLVTRLRRAGFVIIGKTALPEMGIMSVCEPALHGPTNNPWDLSRTPGGSSGGAAAAVAAGMLPLAHGNDGGGSIRIPAACCGLVGLKAARGRVSVGPESGQSFLVCDGVLTRTVADTAALLDVLAGYELGDANWAPPNPAPGANPAPPGAGSWAAAASRDPPAGMRIGLALNPALEADGLDPICRAATERAAGWLEELGHHVEPVTMPWSPPGLLDDFTDAFGPLIAMGVVAGGQIRGRPPAEADVEALTWAIYERARTLGALEYLAAQNRLERLARKLVSFSAGFDLILTPALAQRPPRTGEIHGRGPDPWEHYRRSGAFTPYTAIVNVTGQPAVTLPLYVAADGLPVGVQLIGPPAREDLLLSTAGELERAHPWGQQMTQATRRQAVGGEALPGLSVT